MPYRFDPTVVPLPISPLRRDWPLYLAGVVLTLTVLLVLGLTLGSFAFTPTPYAPPPIEATLPPIPAVVPLATYPTDGAGLPIVVLATATVTPIPPTPTPEPFVWPTATMIRDYSGAVDTGGR